MHDDSIFVSILELRVYAIVREQVSSIYISKVIFANSKTVKREKWLKRCIHPNSVYISLVEHIYL